MVCTALLYSSLPQGCRCTCLHVSLFRTSLSHHKKKKMHHIFSSQLSADQRTGPPGGEGQLMWTLFLSMRMR